MRLGALLLGPRRRRRVVGEGRDLALLVVDGPRERLLAPERVREVALERRERAPQARELLDPGRNGLGLGGQRVGDVRGGALAVLEVDSALKMLCSAIHCLIETHCGLSPRT